MESSVDVNLEEEKFEIQLGEALLKSGCLTQSQLAQAMWEKPERQMRLEEICLDHGWVPPDKLFSMIPTHRLRLGELSYLYGELNFDQLRRVLSQQSRQPSRRLGELLVEQGLLTFDRLLILIQELDEVRRMSYPNSWELIQTRLRQSFRKKLDAKAESDPPVVKPAPKVVALSSAPASPVRDVNLVELVDQAASYKQRILELEKQLEQHQKVQSKEWEKIISRSNQKIDELVDEITTYKHRIQELEQQLATQQLEWDTLCEQSNRQISEYQQQYQLRIDTLEAQLQSEFQKGGDQNNQVAQIHVQLAQKQQHIQMLESERLVLEMDKQQILEQLSEKQAQVDKAQATNARLIHDLAEARRQSMEHQAIAHTQHQLTTQQVSQIALLQEELTRETERRAALEEEIKRLQIENETCQQQLQPQQGHKPQGNGLLANLKNPKR